MCIHKTGLNFLDRFRWIFCQLEVLRDCLPASVQRTLKALPESLDETYERILKEIKKPNRGLAQRVLQCLVVAIRPLRVTELAEVLAVDFEDSEGIPRLNADWRWEDQEQALLIACSSLIAIVETGHLRVVQFSHFSVKEFLTSSRLSTASGEVSAYRIDLENAHAILAQACLGVLLQTRKIDGDTSKDHPLARYAAQHWATHAQFRDVSSRLQQGMKYLFDADKPHFGVWLALFDIDSEPVYDTTFGYFAHGTKSPAAPLYYAALCGFHDLVVHLIVQSLQDVNASGGYYRGPLIAALAGEHFQTADFLRHNGADPNVQGNHKGILLHSAAHYGNFEVVQKLIKYDAEIDARDVDGWTPLYYASNGSHFNNGSVHRLLLELGADVNARAGDGSTPLHWASKNGASKVVRLLLEHGADVEAVNHDGNTALQFLGTNREVDRGGCDEIRSLLVKHGAK